MITLEKVGYRYCLVILLFWLQQKWYLIWNIEEIMNIFIKNSH